MWSQQLWSSCSRCSGLPHRSFCTCSSLPAAFSTPQYFARTLRAAHAPVASSSSSVNMPFIPCHVSSEVLLTFTWHLGCQPMFFRQLFNSLTLTDWLCQVISRPKLCGCSALVSALVCVCGLFLCLLTHSLCLNYCCVSYESFWAFAALLRLTSCFYFLFPAICSGGRVFLQSTPSQETERWLVYLSPLLTSTLLLMLSGFGQVYLWLSHSVIDYLLNV